MPSKRDLKLDQYNISKYAYRELHNFCLQYPEKKKRLTELRSPYSSPKITGLPHGNGISRPTENKAEQAAALASDCRIIEEAAQEASIKDKDYIITAVTQDVPWHYLQLLKGLTTGENKFRQEKRKFYYFLAQKKKII